MKNKIKNIAIIAFIILVAVTTVVTIMFLSNRQSYDENKDDMLSWVINQKYSVFEKIESDSDNRLQVQQINNIRMIEENRHILEVDGEMFNQSGKVETYAYKYNTRIEIQDNQIVQKVINGRPIDGILNYNILLKWPLLEGEEWHFVSATSDGQVLNVSAKISQVIDDKVIVSYSSEDESFSEERTYQKDKGLVIIKTDYMLEGLKISQKYLLEQLPIIKTVQSEKKEDIPLYNGRDFMKNWLINKETVITGREHLKDYPKLSEWFIQYQTAWIEFVNEDDDKIYTLIEDKSRVNQIINEFQKEEIREQFSEIDIVSLTVDDNTYIVSTIETIVVYRNGGFFIEEYEQNYEIKEEQLGFYLVNMY